ncbi:MAG TPA: DUF1573 domain-containing protein [bacterium]|nr:DUF1573 domain-containing protein [bacterium]
MRNRLVILYILMIGLPCFSRARVEFLTPKRIDFGDVQENEQLRGEILFVNRGDEEVTVHRIQATCGCTVTELSRNTYAPGDTASIPFILNTTGFRGVIRKNIIVHFKTPGIPNENVTLQARIQTALEMVPSYINFPHITVNPDTVLTQYVKFGSQLEKPIRITLNRPQGGTFRVIPETFTIPPEETFLVRIELVPGESGRQTETLTFDTDLEEKPRLFLSVSSAVRPVVR